MISGQKKRWWPIATAREAARRAELEAATKILADDRRRRRRESSPAKRPAPAPLQAKNGWISGLADLRRAMREKNRS
jgi:hypothetical protein